MPHLFTALPLALLLAGTPQMERKLNVQYTVTNVGGGLGVYVEEKVLFGMVPGGSGAPRWVAERVRRDRNWCGKHGADGKCVATDTTLHDWLDGTSCTAIAPAFTALQAIRPARFAPVRDFVIVSDSSTVTIKGTTTQAGFFTEISVSQAAGDFATWWHDSSNRWKSCWQQGAPIVEGQALAPSLPASAPATSQ
ncbi:hypothetical protein S2M10_10450 [Sphingomonas sp. S2M10]|uniref:hypothetical protein n=1 Tax=Sphingomonas sp. S2M10 TaxID=2705010 RepID=UPI0014564176|nr:hypothetical protein [Sphingomonas sp. S2M10]NLS26064.1 hypothetical protein [Sphingomonas sp. S2M10]